MGNYIYKLTNKNDDVIYIGKTANIDQRIRQHMNDKKKKWFKTVDKIYYAECLNKTDMDIYEIYYINKLSPCHNIQSVNNSTFSQYLNELVFIELDINIKSEIRKLNKKKKVLTKKLSEEKKYYNIYTYDIGNNYIENLEMLEFYKTHVTLSKEWEDLLKGRQFIRFKSSPCTLDFIRCDTSDEMKDGLYFNPFDKLGIYRMTFVDFIKEISNDNMLPLKSLSINAIDNINNSLEYEMSKNRVAIINKYEELNK